MSFLMGFILKGAKKKKKKGLSKADATTGQLALCDGRTGNG